MFRTVWHVHDQAFSDSLLFIGGKNFQLVRALAGTLIQISGPSMVILAGMDDIKRC